MAVPCTGRIRQPVITSVEIFELITGTLFRIGAENKVP